MAIFLPADLTQPVREVHPANGRTFSLEDLYQLLHCEMVELVACGDGRVLVCDEESKIVGKSPNQRAGEYVVFVSLREVKQQIEDLVRKNIPVFHGYDFSGDLDRPADWIAGDALLCERSEVQ